MNIEQIKKELMSSIATKMTVNKEDLLSSGSTLLNLVCTGYPDGCFLKGTYNFLVGDTSSGKTFLSRTCLAEAAINSNFDEYRLIYDDVEGGAYMDTVKYFGQGLADRLESPGRSADGDPLNSEQIEDFYFFLDDALNEKKPFIYILDSMDSLSSQYEEKKFDEKKKAARKGTEAKGDYGDGKAKINSSAIRVARSRLTETGSILIIINQTRDNIGGGMYEPAKTRSGGHALSFYAMMEIWFSLGSAIKKTVKGKERQIGVNTKAKVKKNRSTGRLRQVDIPIYYSYGIDDLGGMVDYLVSEGAWKKSSGVIDAKGLDVKLKKEALIAYIEEEGIEIELKMMVVKLWETIEAGCEVSRKVRY